MSYRDAFLTPGCCSHMILCDAIIAIIDDDNTTARWQLRLESAYASHNEALQHKFFNYLDTRAAHSVFVAAPLCCPFCVKALPALQKKKKPPTPLMDPRGGDYCGTCSERLMCCQCYPLWAAWEVVEE